MSVSFWLASVIALMIMGAFLSDRRQQSDEYYLKTSYRCLGIAYFAGDLEYYKRAFPTLRCDLTSAELPISIDSKTVYSQNPKNSHTSYTCSKIPETHTAALHNPIPYLRDLWEEDQAQKKIDTVRGDDFDPINPGTFVPVSIRDDIVNSRRSKESE